MAAGGGSSAVVHALVIEHQPACPAALSSVCIDTASNQVRGRAPSCLCTLRFRPPAAAAAAFRPRHVARPCIHPAHLTMDTRRFFCSGAPVGASGALGVAAAETFMAAGLLR